MNSVQHTPLRPAHDASDPPVSAHWREALAAEIAMAEQPHDLPRLRHLLGLYRALGFGDETVEVAMRASRFHAASGELLTVVLDSLIDQRMLNRIAPALPLAANFKAQCPALRQTLARAHEALAQIPQAAVEWCAVLKDGGPDAPGWRHLASFLNRHGDVNGIGALVRGRTPAPADSAAEHYLLFSLLRLHIDHDVPCAREILRRIPERCFDERDLSLSFAIMAFRLGTYERALLEVQHALALDPNSPVAASVQRTIRSFMQLEDAEMPGCHLPSPIIRAAQKTAETAGGDYSWGFIIQDPSGAPVAIPVAFASAGDRFLDIPEGEHVAATYSVLPCPRKRLRSATIAVDPLEILANVDFTAPHVMVQRTSEEPIVHAFVGASGHPEWCWQEVRADLHCGDTAGNRPSLTRRATLWRAACDELHTYINEEEH